MGMVVMAEVVGKGSIKLTTIYQFLMGKANPI